MPYRPKPNNEIEIDAITYRFTEHPAAPGMAYGQTGRRATVYQVRAQDGSLHALKVFTRAWRDPRNAVSAQRLRAFASLPGLQVCERTVFTPETHAELIGAYPDLEYAVLMAWVSGETWQEVMLNGRPLSIDQSREIGLAFLSILERMERESLAHCDLSGPNVLMQFSPIQVALVDVEDLYGPDLARPDKVGGGSSGYAHKTAPRGLWQANADRFAGAILLAEMLGWCDERVRRIGYGEQYFDPAEVQQSSERYQVLYSVLREKWDSGVADAFARAWFSETLEECQSFQEWDHLLNPAPVVIEQPTPEQVAQEKVATAEELLGNNQFEQAIAELDKAYQVAPEIAAGTYARALLTRGTTKERENDREGALADYQKALQVAPEGGLRDELSLIVAEITPKPEPVAAAPEELPAEEAIFAEPELVVAQLVEEVEQPVEEEIVAASEVEPELVVEAQAIETGVEEQSAESRAPSVEAIAVDAAPAELPEAKDAPPQDQETGITRGAPAIEEKRTDRKLILPLTTSEDKPAPIKPKRKIPDWAIALIIIAGIFGAIFGGGTILTYFADQPSYYEAAAPTAIPATRTPTPKPSPTGILTFTPPPKPSSTAMRTFTPTPKPSYTTTRTITSTPFPIATQGAPQGMVLISAGSFQMGSGSGYSNEQPVHTVTLGQPFYMDIYEVTNAQYAKCVDAGACSAPSSRESSSRSSYYGNATYADYPVIYVDWYQANTYCSWRGGRLPTEAEWEYAARGGLAGKVYPWGNTFDGSWANFCDSNCFFDWKDSASNDGYADTAPVGSYAPNGYGLYDMVGNVFEWVNDWYGDYPSGAVTDPTGPSSGDYRVVRGGSWYNNAIALRTAYRYENSADFSYYIWGFRCAVSPGK